MRSTTSVLFALLLTGCSVLDPHNVIGRQTTAPKTDDLLVASQVQGGWRQPALDTVWNTINEHYYDARFNGVDWNAAKAKWAPQLALATSDDQYWELLDKMTGELRDAHTRVHSAKQVTQQKAGESHSLGLNFAEMAGELVLTGINPDSDAWWAGARVGMVIRDIDGEPALPLYRKLVESARETSTPWTKVRGAVRKISLGDLGTSVRMTFARPAGNTADTSAVEEFSAVLKRRKQPVTQNLHDRVLPSGFAYVRFNEFSESLRSSVLAAIDRHKDTPGLILDLRNNGGGSGAMAQAVVEKFLSANHKPGKILTRTGKPIKVMFVTLMALEPEFKGDAAKAYTKPVVVLINENSASAAEIVASTLQDMGRASVIGERSCGCLLGYLGYADLPGGGRLAYSEVGFAPASGKRVEGVGIKPDVEVSLQRADLLAGRDRVLEAAEASLKRKTMPAETVPLNSAEVLK